MYRIYMYFDMQKDLPRTDRQKWKMLNSEGKMTKPLDVTKNQDSSACVFIIPVALVSTSYLQESVIKMKWIELITIVSNQPLSQEMFASYSVPTVSFHSTCSIKWSDMNDREINIKEYSTT